MIKKFKHGFITMRAQPFHFGHKSLVDKMLLECDYITIILGSIQESRTKNNPFTFDERKNMLSNIYAENININIFGIEDTPSDDIWYQNIIDILKNFSFGDPDAYYCGDDNNGNFLNNGDFPIIKLDRIKQNKHYNISGTEIRNMIKNNDDNWKTFIPEINLDYINNLKYELINIL